MFNDFIEFPRFIDVFEMIRQPRTTSILDSYTDEFGFRLIQDFFNVSYCIWRQC